MSVYNLNGLNSRIDRHLVNIKVNVKLLTFP